MTWTDVSPQDLGDNPFRLIGSDWMLITAGTSEKWNTMTASWGGLGVLWNRPVSFIFVRPTRHTYECLEASAWHTLSFFSEKHRPALELCGGVSGRDHDKAAEAGLEPVPIDHDAVTFRQARLVLLARTLYSQDIDPARFVDPSIANMYLANDYHRMYVGSIERVLLRR